MRAAGLDFEEVDVWGKTTEPEYLGKYPAHLTPMLETDGLPRGTLGESCAIMAFLCNKHGLDQFYPTDPGRAGDGRQRDVLFDRDVLSARWRARRTRRSRFGQYPGEVATSDADDAMKAKAAKDAEDALAEPLEVFNTYFIDGQPFIGGDSPSIADIRLAATLEFLRAIDYDFPAWAEDYMSAMESTLGEAYSEPAGRRARLRRVRQGLMMSGH